MEKQQNAFNNQLEKLLEGQAKEKQEKEEAQAEVRRLRSQMEAQTLSDAAKTKQVEQVAAAIGQGYRPPILAHAPQSDLAHVQNPLQPLRSEASKSSLVPESRAPASRGSSARPPPHILALQNQMFPPAASAEARGLARGDQRLARSALGRPGASRQNERQKEMSAYEQMFFGN